MSLWQLSTRNCSWSERKWCLLLSSLDSCSLYSDQLSCKITFVCVFYFKNNEKIFNMILKQGFVKDYTQRLKEGNIARQKLSRLKLSRLRPLGSPGRSSIGSLVPPILKIFKLQLHFQTTTMGCRLENFKFLNYNNGLRLGGSNKIIYSSLSRKKYA